MSRRNVIIFFLKYLFSCILFSHLSQLGRSVGRERVSAAMVQGDDECRFAGGLLHSGTVLNPPPVALVLFVATFCVKTMEKINCVAYYHSLVFASNVDFSLFFSFLHNCAREYNAACLPVFTTLIIFYRFSYCVFNPDSLAGLRHCTMP